MRPLSVGLALARGNIARFKSDDLAMYGSQETGQSPMPSIGRYGVEHWPYLIPNVNDIQSDLDFLPSNESLFAK